MKEKKAELVEELLMYMRPEVMQEVAAMTVNGSSIRDELNRTFDESILIRSLRAGSGELVCAWGVLEKSKSPCYGVTCVWCLTTMAVDKHPMMFWRECKRTVDLLLRIVGPFGNYIDARFTKALRWASALGLSCESKDMASDGSLFHLMVRRK